MRSVLPVAVGLEPALSVSLHKYDGVCGERKHLILPFINTVGLRMGLARRGRAPNKSYPIYESEYLACFFGLFFQLDTPLLKALDFL